MLRIYTMTHKAFQFPEDPIYVPMQVGKATGEDLGYLGDDTGDNISEQNNLYGELTGIYWVWKNDHDSDIVGICHYRRYFLDEQGKRMTQHQYETILKSYDVITTERMEAGGTNYHNFTEIHGRHNLDVIGKALNKCYPQDTWAYEKFIQETSCCYGNLMVTSKKLFDEYCDWLFSIFHEAECDMDVSEFDLYHKRVFGFISEMMLNVWILAKGYTQYFCKVGITSDKVETIEFKNRLSQMIAQGEIAEAKKYFYEYQKKRPDIRLEASDLQGDIEIIEKILYVIYEESMKNEKGLMCFSTDLTTLVHYYKLCKELAEVTINKNHIDNSVELKKILNVELESSKNKMVLSDVMVEILFQDITGTLSMYEYLNEDQQQKKISVIVPVYNAEENIVPLLGNLVHQSLEEIELILIDDASTDKSSDLLKECEKQFPEKIRYYQFPIHKGLANAVNFGLKTATGKYIGFVSCKDIPDVTMYQKLYQEAEKSNYDIVDGGVLYGENQALLHITDQMTGEINKEKRNLLLNNGGFLWSKIIRNECIQKNQLRMKEGIDSFDDTTFLNDVFRAVNKVGNLKEIIYLHK